MHTFNFKIFMGIFGPVAVTLSLLVHLQSGLSLWVAGIMVIMAISCGWDGWEELQRQRAEPRPQG